MTMEKFFALITKNILMQLTKTELYIIYIYIDILQQNLLKINKIYMS